MSRRREHVHVEYVNARDIRNEVSGGMVIAVAFVSYCISEIQNLMSTKIGVIRNFVGIKSNFCKVSYNDNSRIALILIQKQYYMYLIHKLW